MQALDLGRPCTAATDVVLQRKYEVNDAMHCLVRSIIPCPPCSRSTCAAATDITVPLAIITCLSLSWRTQFCRVLGSAVEAQRATPISGFSFRFNAVKSARPLETERVRTRGTICLTCIVTRMPP
eukprot:294440-Amphidinium_carterae.1